MRANKNNHLDHNVKCAFIIEECLKNSALDSYRSTEIYNNVKKMLKDAEKRGLEKHDLRIGEVATRLRVSISFARKLCDTGEIPFYKVGDQRRIKELDLNTYLENRKKKTEILLQKMVDDAQEMDLY